jgi:hypothetical protein
MKTIIALAAMAFTFSAHASDTRLGSVVAVQRQVDNLYSTCIANVNGDTTQPNSFFSCVIPVAKANELSVTTSRFVHEFNDRCLTEGTLQNGKILITFGTAKDESSFNEAKTCLAQGLMKNNSVTATIYTVDAPVQAPAPVQ